MPEFGSTCSVDQKQKAEEILSLHNKVEEIAYNALVDAVINLGISSDSITAQQSSEILLQIKNAAHREMYKSGGYMPQRGRMLTPDQLEGVCPFG